MRKIEIEFDLKKTRLEFSGMGRPLVINAPEVFDPEISKVPVTRFLDESGDYAAQFFAFWQEDCMDPPVWIVRAESFEQAYEDFCGTLPEASAEDLKEAGMEKHSDDLPSGYSYADGVGYVFTENVNGREISLVSATVLP